MKFLVNVDIGVEIDGEHHPVYSHFDADEARAEVILLVRSGRLIPVEGPRTDSRDDSASMLKETDEK